MNTSNSAGTDERNGQNQEPAERSGSKKGPKSAYEQKRLADALRANLSRRKGQKRGRKSSTT